MDEEKHLESLKLPKWCGCVIRGESVSKTLAEEICVRTSGFSICSNSKRLVTEFEQAFGFQELLSKDLKEEDLNKQFQILDLYFLRNYAWCSTSGVPDSWITWDGEICFDSNITQAYPNAKDLFFEWKKIAQAFPTLSLVCQLYPCEIAIIDKFLDFSSIKEYFLLSDLQEKGQIELPKASPILQFTIEKGDVTVQFNNFKETPHCFDKEKYFRSFGDPYFSECRIPPSDVPFILKNVQQRIEQK